MHGSVWLTTVLDLRSGVMAPSQNGRRQRRSPSNYTVDDLAQRTDLTPRTIRSYQTQGLLPPPERHGRVAYYDDSHLDRLEEIAELKEEGLSLTSIHGVLTRREAGSRGKPSRAKARPKGDAVSRFSPAAGGRTAATTAPLSYVGTVKPAPGVDAGTAGVPALGVDPGAKADDDRESDSPKRRLSQVASIHHAQLLQVAAASLVTAFFLSLSDADEDRKRLGRQVSDLQSDLSRLDGSQAPPGTVVVPGPVQQVPVPGAPPATAPSATRTVVVTTPRQAPAAPPATSPAPPATPPTTRCTLNLLGVCL